MDLELRIIDYNDTAYPQVLELRNEILRKPIGLNLYDEDLSDDKNQYIVVGVEANQVVACLMLTIVDKDTVKLRQMAVSSRLQRRGLGTTLVRYAENFCLLNEYSKIILHARKTALDFYTALGYRCEGPQFLEVGIPHFKMTKKLS